MRNFGRILKVQIKEFDLKQVLLAVLLAFFSLLSSPTFMDSQSSLSSLFWGSISGPGIHNMRFIEIFQILFLWTVLIANIMKKFVFYEQMKELIILRFQSIYKWTVTEAISFIIYELLFLILYILSIFLLGLLFCQGNLDFWSTGILALKAFSVYFLDSLLLVLMIFAGLLLFHSLQQTATIIFVILCLNAFLFSVFEKLNYFFPGQTFYIGRVFKLSCGQLKLLITVTLGELALLLLFIWKLIKNQHLYLIEE